MNAYYKDSSYSIFNNVFNGSSCILLQLATFVSFLATILVVCQKCLCKIQIISLPDSSCFDSTHTFSAVYYIVQAAVSFFMWGVQTFQIHYQTNVKFSNGFDCNQGLFLFITEAYLFVNMMLPAGCYYLNLLFKGWTVCTTE